MISLSIRAETRSGAAGEAVFEQLGQPASRVDGGIRIELGLGFPHPVTVTPPARDRLARVTYRLSTPLRNFHEVIVPDTGRGYSSQTQLVDFWARSWRSRVNNVRMPLFVLTGQDRRTVLAFGIVGANVETDFRVVEPAKGRALVAWMKRLTLEVERGTDEYPLPCSAAEGRPDGAITEHVYLREDRDLAGETWIETLRDFSGAMATRLGVEPRTTPESLEPWWCSWTDWFSGDVTDRVVLENVREGVRLGIRNFVIDDGWFGPGLDSDYSVRLNIGDWEEDRSKVPDLAALVEAIRAEGGRAILWCAPHAVAPDARCFAERRGLLIETEPGEPMLTYNRFHSLCFQCPEAREAMADLCAGLAQRYGADGAKYDLFNCVPEGPCASRAHEHDTTSAIEGLARTLQRIDQRTRAVRPGFIVELKQNYATPYLYGYGTVVRAGDTPYSPEGNFLRTAYIAAYTPYALNDYQSVTNHDSPEDAAAMVVKMMAVGVPAYSMDLPTLDEAHRAVLAFLHGWYLENLDLLAGSRTPLGPDLKVWRAPGERKDACFVLDGAGPVDLAEGKALEVLCGSFAGSVLLRPPRPMKLAVTTARPDGGPKGRSFAAANLMEVPARPGDILTVRVAD